MDAVSIAIGGVVIALVIAFLVLMVRDEVEVSKTCGSVNSCRAREDEYARSRVRIE